MPSSRFVDANVFIHAYLKPRRPLTVAEKKLKYSAKTIVARINQGESVLMSIVHFSEVANFLEDHMTPQDARSIEKTICLKEKIDVLTVERADYKLALALAEDIDLGINDALTHVLMKREGIKEIYSFDQDFDRLKDITRLSS